MILLICCVVMVLGGIGILLFPKTVYKNAKLNEGQTLDDYVKKQKLYGIFLIAFGIILYLINM